MSRPKRRSLNESLNASEAPPPIAPSEAPDASAQETLPHTENVTALSRDNASDQPPQQIISVKPSRDSVVTTDAEEGRTRSRRRSPGDNTRHSYHASLYLPEEAQFALREIALVTRRPKPHDVMLEAMADLFERYNKSELAAECRRRITSRDKAKA